MSEEIRRNRDEGESAAVHTWYESTKGFIKLRRKQISLPARY